MAKYAFRARSFDGNVVRGEIEAAELPEARRRLSERKLIVLEISQSLETARAPQTSLQAFIPISIREFIRSRVSPEEMMMFFQQMQTIYAVGISLVHGLGLMKDQAENPKIQSIVGDVLTSVNQGRTLSDSLAQHPRYFDSISISLIKAGESSGRLDEILDRVATLYRERIEQTAKVKSATFYPKIVVGLLATVFFVVVYFVIPKFKDFFARFGGELPFITRFMMGLSEFFTSYWYLVFGAVGFGFFAFKKYTAQPKGKRVLHQLLLKTPIFGPILLHDDIVAFCTTLEMLIKSGLPLTQSLDIARGSMRNMVLREEIEKVQQSVESGLTLRQGLAQVRAIPKVVTNLIGIGEEAGSLELALNRLSSYYRLQVDYKLSNLSKAIEPILLVFVFGMVLALALAVFLPMWKMGSLIKR